MNVPETGSERMMWRNNPQQTFPETQAGSSSRIWNSASKLIKLLFYLYFNGFITTILNWTFHSINLLLLQFLSEIHFSNIVYSQFSNKLLGILTWSLRLPPPQEGVGCRLIPRQAFNGWRRPGRGVACTLARGKHVLEHRVSQILHWTKRLLHSLASALGATKATVASGKLDSRFTFSIICRFTTYLWGQSYNICASSELR